MSKQQYLKALNNEIQKLNGLIDTKILYGADYSREARRHKKLLKQLRRERGAQRERAFFSLLINRLPFFNV